MSHSCRRVAAATAVVGFALACDRPTAPPVRDAAPVVQRGLFGGPGFTSDLGRAITQAVRSPKVFPSAPLDVDRDGHRGRYVATVMERVYVPPAGSGGAPFVRRMLMMWDPESNREFALASDDSISTFTAPTREAMDEQSVARLWGHHGFATQLEEGNADAWVGTSGRLDIVGGTSAGECVYAGLGRILGFPFTEPPSPAGEQCRQMTYSVAATAVLEHRNADGERDLLDRLTGRHITLRIETQDVPGVRVTTQCPEFNDVKTVWIFHCMIRENFWRAESQFATRFGLDFSRLVRLNPSIVAQRIVDGTGQALGCCRQYAGHVRYTVFTPAGAVVRHVDETEAARDTVLREFWIDRALRDGSRTLFLIPARYFDRSASDYTIHVLDLTVLPCPARFRRNDVSFPGNAYPDGGCYPSANFPRGR